jgi:hypothetical protein
MSSGAFMMAVATVLALGALAFLLFATAKSIKNERSKGRSVWREFGLGLTLMILFFGTWMAHGITEWQTFTDDAREHGESPEAGDFFAEFGQSTLENWQSEFLQLFAFVTLAALFIHKGSAESKDGEERIEAARYVAVERTEESRRIVEAAGYASRSGRPHVTSNFRRSESSRRLRRLVEGGGLPWRHPKMAS